MASSDACFSDAGGCSTPSGKDGPVLIMMNKRLRALKKKYNRILQIEEGKSQGKSINKEQEEVLKTKIAVAALIDEYEKLRVPLAMAVKAELVEREKELMAATLRREDEEESAAEEKEVEVHEVSRKEVREVSPQEVRKDLEGEAPAECNGAWSAGEGETAGFEPAHAKDDDLTEEEATEAFDDSSSEMPIADLLKLLYFAQLFDVKSQREAPSLMWTKVHERSSCLSYDFVTEDSTSPLLERDLDALALFGSLVTSRPPNATISHRDALQQCIEHAFLWLQNSDRPISSDLGLNYSHLRERLNRILSSEYFTMTPELQMVSQQTAAAVATAAGQYASQMLMHEASVGAGTLDSDSASMYFPHQDPATAQQMLFQTGEHYTSSLTVDNSLETSDGHLSGNSAVPYPSDSTVTDGIPQFGSQVDAVEMVPVNSSSMPEKQQIDPLDQPAQPEEPHQLQELQQEQQSIVSNVSVGPRGYQGPRGGRGLGYGTGGRGRGYVNGRGRGGRGVYTNGRNGQYYAQGGYYPRNYYGRGTGRGARGGGPMYNGYANGQATTVAANDV